MDDSTELSRRRTDWAEDRTSLANERTFGGWMRTGMASLALAVGLRAVFGAFEPTWAAKLLASVFIGIAIVIFWSARNQACKTHNRLSANDTELKSNQSFTILAALLTFGALGTAAVLWAL